MPRPVRRPPLRAVAALLAAVVLAAGCTRNGDSGGDLPAAAGLLASAADEIATVETARLTVETDANLSDLAVRMVDGTLTRAGDAQGTAQLEQLGTLVEISFVVVGDTFYYQLIGGWQELPLSEASTLYDPSAILDPERGVASLLRTATEAEVEDRETVAGTEAYRVTARLPAAAAGALLPGVTTSVDGTLWIGVNRPLLHRAEVTLPGGTAVVTFSEFNVPAEISAPI